MSKHTKGPWELCEVGDYGDFDGLSRVIIGDDRRLAVVHVSDEETNANAKRIAECVNACEGIEDPSVIPEMLGALKSLAPLAEGMIDDMGADVQEGGVFNHDEFVKWSLVLAIIARVEGRAR